MIRAYTADDERNNSKDHAAQKVHWKETEKNIEEELREDDKFLERKGETVEKIRCGADVNYLK